MIYRNTRQNNTSSAKIIIDHMMQLFARVTDPNLLVRKITIGANHILNENDVPAEVQEQPDLFADPTRLKIINALLISELCVCDLTKILKMTQPAVSHHLKHLRHIRLVKSRRNGKSILYSLDENHISSLFDICKTGELKRTFNDQ